MVSSASQSPVSTSMSPCSSSVASTISCAADSRSPKNPLQLAMRTARRPAADLTFCGLMRGRPSRGLAVVELWPGATNTSATTPAVGDTTWCSIFIASMVSSGWPAATVSPTATSRRTTLPGMGAMVDPARPASSGSVNRGGTGSANRPHRPRHRCRRRSWTCDADRCVDAPCVDPTGSGVAVDGQRAASVGRGRTRRFDGSPRPERPTDRRPSVALRQPMRGCSPVASSACWHCDGVAPARRANGCRRSTGLPRAHRGQPQCDPVVRPAGRRSWRSSQPVSTWSAVGVVVVRSRGSSGR